MVVDQTGSQRGSAIPEIGVLGLVPDRWGGPWNSRHHVLTRLGRFVNVVWFDPAPEWREWWGGRRVPSGHLMELDSAEGGFHLYRPGRWLPLLYRPTLIAKFTEHMRLRRAIQDLRSRGARHLVLYLWRPEFAPVLDQLPHDMSCYHIDDEYSFATNEQPLDPDETDLIKRVDQVIIHSSELVKKKGHLNKRTAQIPNGVDYAAFSAPTAEPPDLRSIRRPRIGYVGWIKEQLNLTLMSELATLHPEWSFVFVGPSRIPEEHAAMSTLRQKANVHFLGSKPVAALPSYVQHMDVCTLPYVVDGYTKYIYPMKLHEYLATGRPVVGTPISALLDFSHVVSLGSDSDEWSEALEAALAPEAVTPEAAEIRRLVARANDWNLHVTTITELFCEHFGPQYLDRLSAANSATARDASPSA